MAYVELSQTLAESFNALADEVQTLADRKTVLEHKLRFAHEQFQYLADKYAPAAPEIADTLSKLQLPPHTSVDNHSPVPLPQRTQPSQHHLALVIRDGRRAASRLAASLGDASKTTVSSKGTFSHDSNDDVSSMSTALEQDFTVQGKRSALQCPFQKPVENTNGSQSAHNIGTSHYDPSDPICAALADGTESSHAATGNGTSAPSKCPIRFLDKHSPEEVARYVEMHKHELPRSHEVCLRRYGRNEQEVRKLDSKYGNIASMIEDLGQLHQPMLPEDGGPHPGASDTDEASNRRVESWANGVNASTHSDNPDALPDDDQDRQSHFDRPLKEVRVGESPSRPWGISVPVYEADDRDLNLLSPPAAPLKMPTPHHPPAIPSGGPKKCPFDHKLAFGGGRDGETPKPPPKDGPALQGPPPFTPFRDNTARMSPVHSTQQQQPVFVAPDAVRGKSDQPQMIFTGPVFIGYPMDQALQFMNQFQRRS
ncbi:hypothetical protein ISF_02745 [Cordyceps fumosorosea ARSEF 2679]|uniref:Uncharacterized protein n=1 Tax=Cordyceps fumosorosea (strain ARSEF 2679) TaxID=1081104 RepID=A0A168B182_CORFA|nr:hypothetical protein ISF_02745 [Cordyceps fumosorosea ARSEF 2679]OAA69475.1 hypothetical protein ISF_02745 [Cordyceps fumosorosea ARSEF 2679]